MTTTKPRLSICITANGSPDELARCLQSLHALDAEILVAGPAGELAAAAARQGARYIATAGAPALENQRQTLLAHAAGRWVLILDAAEELIEGHDDLNRLTTLQPQGSDLCLVEIIGIDGRGLAARLHPLHPDMIWPGESDSAVDRRMGEARTGATLVTAVRLRRRTPVSPERGVALLRQGLSRHPRDPHLHYHLGIAQVRRGDPRGGLRHLRRALAGLAEVNMGADYAPSATTLAMGLALQLGHLAVARRLALADPGSAAGSIAYWLNRGAVLTATGDLPGAQAAWLTGWQLAQTTQGQESQQLALLLAAAFQDDPEQGPLWRGRAPAAPLPLLLPAKQAERLTVAVFINDPVAGASGLASVQTIADELLVIGDEAAQAIGAGFAAIPGEQTGTAKGSSYNELLANVTTDWLLILEAGETLDAGAIPPLQQLLVTTPPTALAFSLTGRTRHGGSPGQGVRRLVRCLTGLQFTADGQGVHLAGTPMAMPPLAGATLWQDQA